MNCLVLSAKTYDFNNKEGQRIQGSKISYISDSPTSRDNEYGNPPFIVNLSTIVDDVILNSLPAICNLKFEQVTGKNNKPELVLTDLELVSQIELSLLF